MKGVVCATDMSNEPPAWEAVPNERSGSPRNPASTVPLPPPVPPPPKRASMMSASRKTPPAFAPLPAVALGPRQRSQPSGMFPLGIAGLVGAPAAVPATIAATRFAAVPFQPTGIESARYWLFEPEGCANVPTMFRSSVLPTGPT
jgi:hypothetical protein